MSLPPIRVMTYTGASQAAAAAEFEADARRAAAAGYVATSMAWQGNSLTVTYQLQAAPPPPPIGPSWMAPQPPKPRTKGSRVAGAIVLVVLALLVLGVVGRQPDEGTFRIPGETTSADLPIPGPDGNLSLSDVAVTSRVAVGSPVQVRFHGTSLGPGVAAVILGIDGPSGKAKFTSCTPECEDQDEILGTRFLAFPDLGAGDEQDYTLLFRTLEAGHIDWSIAPKGSDWEWTATTVVAP